MDEIVLLRELVAQYIKEKSLTTPTQKNYIRIADQFSRETGFIKLDGIDFEKLLAWRIDVIARSSSTTWNNYLRHLRALWNFAITRGYLHSDHNPFNDLHWGKAITKRPKVLSETEIRRVITVIKSESFPYPPGWFWEMVIRFLYYSGLRRRQIVGLKWSNIDLKKGIIKITPEIEKTGRERDLPIGSALADLLQSYRKTILKTDPSGLGENCQVFNVTLYNPNYRTDVMTVSQLSGFFRRLTKQVGFPVSAHMFRHTMATEIAKSGQIKELQEILGHSDVRTTLTSYVHPQIEALRNSMNGLSDI